MEGGRLLDQGTYGCIFDPPLLCEDAVQKKKGRQRILGKISQEEDVENEIYASEVLSEIPKSADYFVLPDLKSVCMNPLDMDKQPDQKGIEKCDAIKRYGTKDMVLYSMPFGGINIRKYIASPIKEFPVRSIVTHILEGAALMSLNGFIHYDIHLGNIIIDTTTQTPRFIDFGWSFSSYMISADTVDERWKTYLPSHPIEPPEITVLNGLRKGFQLNKVITEVIQTKLTLKDAEKIVGLSRYAQLRDIKAFWSSSIAAKKKDNVEFFRMYWPAFDAWGIGMVVLYLYKRALQVKSKDSDMPAVLPQLKELARSLLRADPRKRLDCVEALYNFSPSSYLLQSPAGRAWIEQKDKVRAEISKRGN